MATTGDLTSGIEQFEAPSESEVYGDANPTSEQAELAAAAAANLEAGDEASDEIENEGAADSENSVPEANGSPESTDPTSGEPAEIVASDSVEGVTQLQVVSEPTFTELQAAHLKQILAVREEVRRAKFEYDGLREEAKAAKKQWEAAVAQLGDVIDAGPRRMPLFDGQAAACGEQDSNTQAIEVADQPAADQSQDWRAVNIGEVSGLSGAMVSRLIELGIETIGQLEDLRGGKGLTSLPGVGQAKAQKIEDAVLEWLSEHRDKAALQAAACGERDGGESSETDDGDVAGPGEGVESDAAAVEPANAKQWCLDVTAEWRSDFLRGDINYESLTPNLKLQTAWKSGVAARDEGQLVTACQFDRGSDESDDWLAGWLHRNLELAGAVPGSEPDGDEDSDEDGDEDGDGEAIQETEGGSL